MKVAVIDRTLRNVGEFTPVLRAFFQKGAFARDVAVLSVSNNVVQSLSFFQAILVARWLGPASYGTLVLLMSIPDILFGLVDARTSHVITKYLQEFRASRSKEQASAIRTVGYLLDISAAALVIASVYAAAGEISARVLHNNSLLVPLYLYSVGLLFRSLIPTSASELAVSRRFSTIAKIETGCAVVRTTLILGSLLLGWGIVGIVASNVAYGALRGLLMTMAATVSCRLIWNETLISVGLRSLKGRVAEVARFIVQNDVAALIATAMKQLDVVLVGIWLGAPAAGFFRIAKNLPGVWNLVGGPLQLVAYQRLTGMVARGEVAAVPGFVRRLTLWIGGPLAAGTLLSIPLLPVVVKGVIGAAYEPAVPLAGIFFGSSVIGVLLFWLQPLYLALGEPGVWAIGNLLTSITYGLVGIPMLFRYGLVGFATGFLIANFTSACILAWRQSRRFARHNLSSHFAA